MIAQFLFGLIADLVFDAAASKQRSFGAAMNEYLEQQGLMTRPRVPREVPTH